MAKKRKSVRKVAMSATHQKGMKITTLGVYAIVAIIIIVLIVMYLMKTFA